MRKPAQNRLRDSLMEVLEDRVLFDGVPDATFVLPVDGTVPPPTVDVAQLQQSDSAPVELVLIDAGVQDSDVLLASIVESQKDASLEIRFLTADESGIEQITTLLQNSQARYDAIHVISHGSAGEIQLGSEQVGLQQLTGHAGAIAQWADALSDDADILFYGCNLGDSSAGTEFIETMSALTGADVAASDDLTGNAALGGDWDLEVTTGKIEAGIVIDAAGQQAFTGVLAPTPVATVNVNGPVMLGESFDFSVVMENAGSPGDVGFQPFIDIVLPTQGVEDVDEGIHLVSNSDVTFLGQTNAVTVTTRTFDASGEAVHPLTGETILGTPGDTLIIAQPLNGSFAPGQPEITIDVKALLSELANIETPLSIVARAGFDFGGSPTDSGNILSDGADSSTWTASGTIAPQLLEISKTYIGTEDETATGPNFARQYQLDLNVADGQTINDLDITDYLPNNARFLRVVSATSTDGATVFTETAPVYTLDPVTNELTYPDPHQLVVNASTVTGQAGDTPEITVIFEYYIAEFDSEGDRVIPDDNALGGPTSGDGEDDIAAKSLPDHALGTPELDLESQSPNDADALGTWVPIDTDDPSTADNAYAEPIDGAPDHILDDKSIAIQKSVALVNDTNSTGYSPGDVVEYTLDFQISDYYTFGDLSIYDIMGDGLLFDQTFDPTFEISDRSGNFSGTFNFGVTNSIGDQQTPGAADTYTLPGGVDLLVDESRVDRSDDASENSASDGKSHLIFDIEKVLSDNGRANGVLQGGVILTGAENRPTTGAQEHDDNPNTAATGTIKFRAVIQQEFADEFPSGDRSVDHGDVLLNTVDIFGTVRDNINNSQVTHREDDDSGASIATTFGQISKTIYAINGEISLGSSQKINPRPLIVGDTVTYSIEYTLPNSNFENLQLHDFLPFPVLEVDDPNADDNSDESTQDDGPAWFFDSSAPSADVPAVGVISIGANDTLYGIGTSTDPTAARTHYENNVTPSIDWEQNRLTMSYGDFDTDLEAGSTINILFTVRVNDQEFDPGVYLTNTTRVTEASTNGPDNIVDDLVLVQMERPWLQIRKGVVSTSGPDEVYSRAIGPTGVTFAEAGSSGSPFTGTITHNGLNSNLIDANVSSVSPGDTVRFAVVLRNWASRAPMFDVQFRDSLPSEFTYVENSLQVVDGTGATLAYSDLDGAADGSGFFGTGIELIDQGATSHEGSDGATRRGAIDGRLAGDGQNIAIAFYDVIVDNPPGNTTSFTNTARWFHGALTEGGADLVGSASNNATVGIARVDLEVNKSVSDPSPNIGDVVTWTIEVTNNAANATTAATGVVIGDALPSGQTLVIGSATDTTGGTFDYLTGEWTLGSSIAAGATETLTFKSIAGYGSEFSGSHVDLELNTQIDNSAPQEGDTVNVTVELTNNGEAATVSATGVTVGDLMPAGLTFVGSSATADAGSFNGATGLWDLSGDTLAVGQTVKLTFQATVNGGTAGTSFNLTPEVKSLTQTDIDSIANNASTSEDDDSNLTIQVANTPATRNVSGTVFQDSNNDGLDNDGADLSNIRVTAFDADGNSLGTTLTNGSGNYSFVGITDGAIRLEFTEIADDMFSSSVTGDSSGTVAFVEAGSASATVNLGLTDSGTTIEVASRLWVDEDRDGIQDAGEATLSGVTLELFDVSTPSSPVSMGTTTTTSNGHYSFSGLSANTNYEIHIAASEFAAGGLLDNYHITKRDQQTVVVAETTQAVSAAATLDRTGDGTNDTADVQTFNIRQLNNLGADGYQILITDMNNGVARLQPDGQIEFEFEDHATSGDFKYIILTDRVDSDASGYDDDADGMTDRAIVSFTTGETGEHNHSLDIGVIEEFIDLELNKTVLRKLALEEEHVTFTLTLSNKADVLAATGVTVADNLPAGLTYVAGSAVTSAGTFDGSTWTITGALDAGETVTLTYRAAVADGIAGSVLKNSAQVITVDQVDIDSQVANDNGDRSQDDEDDAVVLIGTRTSTTITNVAQVTQQDQADWDSTPNNDDQSHSEDDEDDASFTFLIPGAIGNTVWIDEDSNGVVDAGEPGIPNVVVQLKNSAGVVIDTTVTDQNGNYLFPALEPGSYFVDIDESTLPPGVTQTTAIPSAGQDQTNQAHTADGYAITIGPGEENMSGDFGYNYNPTGDVDNNTGSATLGDRVWVDTNGDGFQDPGEVGVEGVTVNLYTDPDGDGVYDNLVGTDVTDETGHYLFDDLPANSYVVDVVTTGSPVDGWTQTGDPEDFGAPATDPDNQSDPVVLTNGDVNLDIDFGYQPGAGETGTIGSTVWYDLDNSADDETNIGGEPRLEDVSVSLIKDTNGNGVFDTGEKVIATDLTDENGQYLFTGLSLDDGDGDADYIVWVNDSLNVLDKMRPTFDADGIGTEDLSAMALSSGNTTDLDQDFSFSHSNSGVQSGGLGDTIFLDRNNNGLPDPGEGIEGVEVLVYDAVGRLAGTVTTDHNGRYYVDQLDPDGTYTVEVVTDTLPPGIVNSVDPDGGLNNTSVVDLSLNPSGINLDQDFGYVPSGVSGSIGTLIWTDTNRDGTADGANGPDGIAGNDDDEAGLAGVTVDLYIDNNGDGVLNSADTIIGTTVTDADGNYLFSNLPVQDGGGNPINYIVDVTDRDAVLNGYVHSLGLQGVADDNESKSDSYAVQLTNAAPDVFTADFGYHIENAALGNFVWIDVDRDGIQDPEDFGVNNVPVTLSIEDGSTTIIATVLTQRGPNGKDGWYSFKHLLADEDLNGSEATYTLSIGTHFTSANHYSLIPTLVNVDSGGATPDREDSDSHAGVVANPVVGFTDVNDLANENSEQDIASYDFGFVPTDHGDLPEVYDTSNANLGPFHEIDHVTFLGNSVDYELDGQSNANATGDGADEDGVEFLNPLFPGRSADIRVTASVDGFLNAWIDFDSNGMLDEVQVTHVNGSALGTPVNIDDFALTAGTTTLTVDVPTTATGTMAARFRFSDNVMGANRSTTGHWDNGEVEDYMLGALGDIVWLDNGAGTGTGDDGVQNGSEAGIPNVVVNLLNSSGAAITDANGVAITTTTDPSGNYEFPGLPPGSYKVSFELPTGYQFTNTDQGGNDAVDSDANEITGVTDQTYIIGSNTTNPTVDAGMLQQDYGDLPDAYGTTNAANGAAHGIDGETFLGAGVDAETNGQPNANATGDDATDDEDGIVFLTPLVAGQNAEIRVTASVDGYLNAWIDFDTNGSLDEVLVTHVNGTALGTPVNIDDLSLTAGATVLTIEVPTSATGVMAARFRFSSDAMGGNRSSTGAWDNGEVEDYVLGSIGNLVFEDNGVGGGESGDGIQNGTEPGIANVTVYLLDGGGNRINDPVTGNPISTTTDANGIYEFAGLPPGDYSVEFSEPTGFDFTDQHVGNDALDSDADPTDGKTHVTNISAGETDTTLDAGLVEYDYGDLPDGYGTTDASGLGPARHVVDDTTFLGAAVDGEDDGQPSADATADGADEDGIVFLNPLTAGHSANIRVTASVDGFLNAWIDFDSNGTLDEVQVTHVDGVALGTPVNIDDLALNAGINTLTIDVPTTATGNMAARFRFTEDAMGASRSANNDWDNGEVEDYVLGTIGDLVWLDNGAGGGQGNDGIQNGAEAGIPNVVVNLLNAAGNAITDASGTAITTTTDSSGNYHFYGLPVGDYKVSFELPENFQFSDTNQGANDALDSDANETTGITDQTYTIAANTVNLSVDAGMLQQDGGDLPDVYGTTRAANGPMHGLDGATFLGAGVDADSNGVPGSNATGDDLLDANDDEDGVVFLSPLTAGAAAEIRVTASVDGFLNAWIDFDSNGTLDEIVVTHVDGVALGTPTNVNDLALTAGATTLTIDVPSTATGTMAARFRFTNNAMGTDRATTGAWDNGEVEDYVLGAIGNVVFEDNGGNGTGVAGDGLQDANEPGVANVTVYLLDAAGARLQDTDGNEIQTTTDSNGFYEFAGLPAGDYRVEFALPAGFEFTDKNVGTNDAVDSDADIADGRSDVTNISPGETDNTLDAGIVEYDYGDLPDGYGTTNGSLPGAAKHVVDDVTFLGSSVDSEADGQPSVDATADGADENGIVFVDPLMPGVLADIDVTASVDGFLNAWIDFDSDGTLDEVLVTHVDGVALTTPVNINDLAVNAGTTTLTVDVPTTATGNMAARFRFTSDAMGTQRSANNAWDNGEVEDYVMGSIGDIVWLDNGAGGGTGNDGIQNGAENGIANVVVNLLDSSGNAILDASGTAVTTQTDANGAYEFVGLPTGDYRVEFIRPTGYQFTETNAGSDDTVDSDADENTGVTTQTYSIAANTTNLTVDAGMLQQDFGDLPDIYGTTTAAAGASHGLDGRTFLGAGVDAETDGQPNSNATADGVDEDGIVFLHAFHPGRAADIQVTASVDGFLNAWADFDSNGTLDEMRVTHVDGVALTTPVDINDLALTAGTTTLTIDVPSTATGTMATRFRFSDTAMNTARSATGEWDSGEVEDYVLGAIGDLVWMDNGDGGGTGADGIQNGTEPPVAGVIVNLLNAAGIPVTDANGQPITTITDAEGNYEFPGLPAGSYKVEFELPVGLQFTDTDSGNNDAADSDAHEITGITDHTYTVIAGTNDRSVDAGLQEQDFGDLPDTFLTTTAAGGPTHGIDGATFLGSQVDAELEGQPSANATGDDLIDTNDDEDGIVFLQPLAAGTVANIQVTASIDGFLNAWVDFNGNGTFEASEQIATDEALTAGTNIISVNVPADATGISSARFRFTSDNTSGTLAPDGNWDNGEVEDYMLASIGNYVWYDNGDGGGGAGDGIQDAGEPAKDGVVLFLLDAAGNRIQDANGNDISTVSDINGFYEFGGLTDGDYAVEVVPPTGFGVTNQNLGGNDATDSDVNQLSKKSDTVSVVAGQHNDTLDIGLARFDYGDLPANYGNTTFIENGARHVVDNVTFLGSLVDIDADGNPSSDALGDNNHNSNDEDGVVFVTPLVAGFQADIQVTASVDGYLNAWIDFDSDGTLDEISVTAIDGVALTSPVAVSDLALTAGSHTITIAVPETATGTMAARFRFTHDTMGAQRAVTGQWENGEVEDYVLGAIGDVMFYDNGVGTGGVQGDGIQNGTENGVPGANVYLLNASGSRITDPAGNDIVVTTDVDGRYEFSGLPAGDYKVEFELPADHWFTVANRGNDTFDSDANFTTGITDQVYSIAPSQIDNSVDAGILPDASLGDRVWFDIDADGQQDDGEPGMVDMDIRVNVDIDGDGITDYTETTRTDADGFYLFDSLPPGEVTVVLLNPPAGFRGTYSADGGNTSDYAGTLAINAADRHVDFGLTGTSSLAGTVHEDGLDDDDSPLLIDGIQDAIEPGIPDVPLTLQGVTDTGIVFQVTTTTDANGDYQFNNLPPGTYTVLETQPTSKPIVAPVETYQDGLDTVGSLGGFTAPNTLFSDVISNIPVGVDQHGVDYDFSEIPEADPNGYVFLDNNDNGIFDPGEEGIAGVQIRLEGTDVFGNSVSETKLTDENGFYFFDGLNAGTYRLIETQPEEYRDGKEQNGSPEFTVSNDMFSDIVLGWGDLFEGYNFGEQEHLPTAPGYPPTFPPLIPVALQNISGVLSNGIGGAVGGGALAPVSSPIYNGQAIADNGNPLSLTTNRPIGGGYTTGGGSGLGGDGCGCGYTVPVPDTCGSCCTETVQPGGHRSSSVTNGCTDIAPDPFRPLPDPIGTTADDVEFLHDPLPGIIESSDLNSQSDQTPDEESAASDEDAIQEEFEQTTARLDNAEYEYHKPSVLTRLRDWLKRS